MKLFPIHDSRDSFVDPPKFR